MREGSETMPFSLLKCLALKTEQEFPEQMPVASQ